MGRTLTSIGLPPGHRCPYPRTGAESYTLDHGRAGPPATRSGGLARRLFWGPTRSRGGRETGRTFQTALSPIPNFFVQRERGQDRAPTQEPPRTRTGPPPGQTRPAREPPPGKRRAGPAGQGRRGLGRGLGGRRAAAGGGRREGESLRATEPATTATFEWTESVGRYGVACPTSGGLGYLAPRSLVREWTRA